MLGRLAIGRVGIAMSPTSTIKMLQTVVRTGFLMKLSEKDIASVGFGFHLHGHTAAQAAGVADGHLIPCLQPSLHGVSVVL